MLRKTKIFLIIGSITLLVTIIVVLITRSLSTPQGTITEPVIPEETIKTSSILIQSDNNTAIKAKSTLLPKLPINIKGFQTSANINTDISIDNYPNDDPDIVRVEIYNIDYTYDQKDPATNPDMVAFKESFEKVISILKENGVEIQDLHILMSNRQYIQEISESWIRTLNLLP